MDIRPPGTSPYPDPPGYQQPAPPPFATYPAPPSPPRPGYAYPGAPGQASPYPPGPVAPVTYRPSLQHLKTTWRAGGIAIGVVALLVIGARVLSAFQRGGLGALLITVALVVVLVGAILGTYLVYLRTLSITVDAGGATRRAFGRARRIPRGVLQRVVLVSYTMRSRYTAREVPLVALLDASGHSRLTLNLQNWSEADARAMVSQLGLMDRVTSLGHREPRQLKQEVPGALPWMVAHRAATMLLVLGITLVMVVLVVVGFVLAGS